MAKTNCKAKGRGKRPRPLWKSALLGLLSLCGGIITITGAWLLILFFGYTFGHSAGEGLIQSLNPETAAKREDRPRERRYPPLHYRTASTYQLEIYSWQ